MALTTFMLVVLALAISVQGAAAGRLWCRTDPLLLVEGRLIDVAVSGPLLAALKVTGPTEVVLLVPEGADAHVLINDLGFGRGYRTNVQHVPYLEQGDGYTEIQFRVYVPSRDRSMPIMVDVAEGLLGVLNPTTVYGTANTWITMNLTIRTY